MPRRVKEAVLVNPSAFPKEVQQAALLEKCGFKQMASKARHNFNERVKREDPTTGVDFS